MKLTGMIRIRFLRERTKTVMLEVTRRVQAGSVRITGDLGEAWRLAFAAATPRGEPIVLCDRAGRPINLVITDVP